MLGNNSSFQRDIKKEGNIEDFYIIEENEILGKGASAVVRKGIKIDTGEAFAIKIINKSSLTQDEKESLHNELKIMGMVDHPNIVRVQEYYECNGLVFIVMELIGTSFQLVDMFTVVRTLTSYGYSGTDASTIMNIVTTLGTKLNVIVMAIANGIVVSLLPSLTSDYVKGDINAVKNKINKTIQIILYLTIPMSIGLSLLAVPVWNIFYGQSFYGPKVFMVSIFVAVFGSIFTNVVVIMQSLSRYKKMYLGLFLGFGFNAIMNMPFMILFGKIGLPMYYGNLVATMIGYGITIFICLYDLKKAFKISYKQTFKDLVYILITCSIMSFVILTIKHFIPMDDLSRVKSIVIVAIYAVIGMAIYGGITYLLGMFNRIIGLKLKRSKK